MIKIYCDECKREIGKDKNGNDENFIKLEMRVSNKIVSEDLVKQEDFERNLAIQTKNGVPNITCNKFTLCNDCMNKYISYIEKGKKENKKENTSEN